MAGYYLGKSDLRWYLYLHFSRREPSLPSFLSKTHPQPLHNLRVKVLVRIDTSTDHHRQVIMTPRVDNWSLLILTSGAESIAPGSLITMSFRDTLTSWGQVLPRTPPSDRKNKPAGKENSASGSRRQRFFDRAAATLGKSFTSPRGRRSPNTWKATVSEQPSDSSPTRKSIRKRLSTSFFQRNGPNSDELAETQERNACNKAGSVHAIEPSSEPLGVTGSDEPGDTDDAYQQLIAATTEGRIVSMPESMRPLLSCRDSRRDTPDSYLQLLIKSCERLVRFILWPIVRWERLLKIRLANFRIL